MERWPRLAVAVGLIGICILARRVAAAAAEGAGEKAQLAVVTRRPVPGARQQFADHDGNEDEDGKVEYNIAAFGKDYRLQFSKNKKLLRRGFRMQWKQSDGQPIRSYLPQGAADCHYLHRNLTDGAVAAISDCRPGQLRGFVATKDDTFELSPLTSDDLAGLFGSSDDLEFRDSGDNSLDLEDVNVDDLYVVKRVKLPNFIMEHELDIPDDDEAEFTFKSTLYSDIEKRKTVELALFLDHTAYSNFHLIYKKDEIVEIVLAFANQLSAIYHMPSLGQIVDFSIVKLEVHEDEEPFENHDGEKYGFIESFCDYNNGLNEGDDRHPGHWDLGVYLTGVDLYTESIYGDKQYGTLGVARTRGMCSKKFSCAITEFGVPKRGDPEFGSRNPTSGFSAVYVLAHEIGHSLGMRHDGQSGNDCDYDGYIMSADRGSNIREGESETKWSNCSAEYLRRFSKSCLDDEPGLNRDDFQHERFGGRPGMYFGAHSQCKLFLMDTSAMQSATSTDDVCHELRCVHSDVASRQSPVDTPEWAAGPALDGTECDVDGFCLGGECVRKKRWYVNSLAEEYYGECNSGCLERSMGVRKRVLVYDTDKVKDREPLAVTEELCRDEKTCSQDLSELATITLGFLSFSKGNSKFKLKTNERRESRRDYATAKCRRILSDEDTVGMPAIHSEENPAQACMLFCKRESPAPAGNSTRGRRRRQTRWKSLLQRIQRDVGWVDDLSEAFFPDGTWCHRDMVTGEDFFCLNKECKSLEREKERADARRLMRNLRSRLLFL